MDLITFIKYKSIDNKAFYEKILIKNSPTKSNLIKADNTLNNLKKSINILRNGIGEHVDERI